MAIVRCSIQGSPTVLIGLINIHPRNGEQNLYTFSMSLTSSGENDSSPLIIHRVDKSLGINEKTKPLNIAIAGSLQKQRGVLAGIYAHAF